jgi:hypothetical protein
MKNLKQTPQNEQDHFRAKESVKGSEKSYIVGLKGVVTEPPTAARSALPCLSNINSSLGTNTGLEVNEEKPSSACIKAKWGLEQNIKVWETIYGLDRLGFLTVTCVGNIKCKREYARRWKRFYNHFGDCGIEKVLVRVDEPQKRGAWHSHCIVLLKSDIRTGFNWESYKHARQLDQIIYQGGGHKNATKTIRDIFRQSTQRYAESANPLLRSIWHRIRKASRKSGFGRTEVMPIQHSKACGQYASKYLEKGFGVKTPETHRMRKVNYCKGIHRRIGGVFSWVNGPAQEWRKNMGGMSRYYGIREDNEARQVDGKWIKPDRDFQEVAQLMKTKKWAYLHGDYLSHIGERERFVEDQGLEGREALQARYEWDQDQLVRALETK